MRDLLRSPLMRGVAFGAVVYVFTCWVLAYADLLIRGW